MIINVNSQLGLQFRNKEVKQQFANLIIKQLEAEKDIVNDEISNLNNKYANYTEELLQIQSEELVTGVRTQKAQELIDTIERNKNNERLANEFLETLFDDDFKSVVEDESDFKLFLITDSILIPSSKIKLSDNFNIGLLSSMKNGKYSYLMGKNETMRFIKKDTFIKGLYYQNKDNIAAEFYMPIDRSQFNGFNIGENFPIRKILKLFYFIELADIEVSYIEAGKSNNKSKNNGKITNQFNEKVYVVDSTWNQILIRTDGFPVIGHFRLQRCGKGLSESKLIWIKEFEKHGYKRNAKKVLIT